MLAQIRSEFVYSNRPINQNLNVKLGFSAPSAKCKIENVKCKMVDIFPNIITFSFHFSFFIFHFSF